MKSIANPNSICTLSCIAFFLAVGLYPAAAAGPLTLDECIKIAAENSPAISSSEAEQNQAEWRLKEVKAGKLPVLTYDFTGSYQKLSPHSKSTDNYDYQLTLDMPLYTWGRIEGQIDAAALDLKIKEYEVIKAKHQLIMDVTEAFYTLLQAQNALSLAEESIGRITEHQKQVQLRYNLGNAAKIDLIRLDVELANNTQNLIKAKTAYQTATANLNKLLGKPLGEPIAIEDTDFQTVTTSQDSTAQTKIPPLEYYLAGAEKSRPEIAQADLNLKIAKRQVSLKKSNYFPTLSLGAAINRNDGDFPGLKNENWSAHLLFNWTLFDSGQTNAQINQVHAELTQAEINLKELRDQIKLEVYQAYLSLLEAEKIIETTQKALLKAEEEYQIVKLTYEKGFETSLNVLDNQVTLTEAKNNYLQALFNYQIAKAKLSKAAGL